VSKTPEEEGKKIPEGDLPKFRQEALAELNTPEQLDKLIEVVSSKGWVALAGFFVLLVGMLFWGIFGSIPTRVQGLGLLLVENGAVYNAVAPSGGGRVDLIVVQPAQTVHKGAVLAQLARPDLAQKLELQKAYLERLKQAQVQLQQAADKELVARHAYIKDQDEALKRNIVIQTQNLKDIEKLLAFKEDNFKKGLMILQDIEVTRRDYYAAKQMLGQTEIQITQLKAQTDDFEEQWRQKLKESELAVLSEKLKFSNMQTELQVSKTVMSPADGMIISINTAVGKMVPEGGSIASIATLGEGLDVLAFMMPKEGEKVMPGMTALVTPANIEQEEYGSMQGTVLSVSTFPEGSDVITAMLHNEDLVKQFEKSGSPIGIRVRIVRDPKTFSGYKWTSSKGPEKKITLGNLADIRITVREQPPLSLIIPTFKKLFRVS